MDLSSHNANPPGVFDGEAIPLSDVADTRIEESVAALREFVAEHGSLPTAESWTKAAMRPSEKTIRRRFGSFREAIQRAALTGCWAGPGAPELAVPGSHSVLGLLPRLLENEFAAGEPARS